MSQYIKIKPRPGLKIPDPYMGDKIPESGRRVLKCSYWTRLHQSGSIEIIEELDEEEVPSSKKGKRKLKGK